MKKITADLKPMGSVPEEDAKSFIAWAWAQRDVINLDPHVVGYPRSVMATASRDGQSVAMVPLHPVINFESFVRDPDMPDRDVVQALAAIDKLIPELAQQTGMLEFFFETSIEKFKDLCIRHGWQVRLFDSEKKIWLLKRKIEFIKD